MPTVRPPPRTARAWRALPLALALAACGKDLSVNVRAGDRPPDPDAEAESVNALALVSGVAVDRVRLVLRDLRLQSSPTPDGSAAPGDQAVSPSLLVVDLSAAQLAPGAMTEVVPARDVSWESFYQTVVDLRPVTAGEAAADPALAPLEGRTVVITGRLPGGAPFTYESAVSTVLLRPSVFRVGLNHNHLTLNLAVNRWFEGPAGEPLDPSSASTTVQATIEQNILDSIDAYMDDNQDGNPDFLG